MKTHDNQPSIEQWKELYEVARIIRKLEPWKLLWDMDLITIMLPGREEPVYCSVMGRGGECIAIGVYPGFESVDTFYRMAEAVNSSMSYLVGLEQDCLMCFFGDREEVTKQDREVYKELGLRFRGRHEWIYFRSMIPGYIPWHIDSEQADLLIQALQNLVMSVEHYKNDKIKVDFDLGETLLRFYSPEDELWYTKAVELPPRLVTTNKLIVSNETLIAKLKKHKQNKSRLEFDVTYLPTPLQENKDERPFFPRFIVLMDKNSELLLDQYMAGEDDHIEAEILDMLTRYIMTFDRPKSINVRNEQVTFLIGDFCDKLGIKLIDDKGVQTIDGFLEGLLNSMM